MVVFVVSRGRCRRRLASCFNGYSEVVWSGGRLVLLRMAASVVGRRNIVSVLLVGTQSLAAVRAGGGQDEMKSSGGGSSRR